MSSRPINFMRKPTGNWQPAKEEWDAVVDSLENMLNTWKRVGMTIRANWTAQFSSDLLPGMILSNHVTPMFSGVAYSVRNHSIRQHSHRWIHTNKSHASHVTRLFIKRKMMSQFLDKNQNWIHWMTTCSRHWSDTQTQRSESEHACAIVTSSTSSHLL